jgi:hypothetical protein
MYLVEISRFAHEAKQTLGLLIATFKGKQIFACKTLELPWKDNCKQVSCIPAGTYSVIKRYSPKYGNHFYIQNVVNRDYILIHHGNYHTDILGCILVGRTHQDINGDGFRDVTSSKVTMQELNKALPKTFKLIIK